MQTKKLEPSKEYDSESTQSKAAVACYSIMWLGFLAALVLLFMMFTGENQAALKTLYMYNVFACIVSSTVVGALGTVAESTMRLRLIAEGKKPVIQIFESAADVQQSNESLSEK